MCFIFELCFRQPTGSAKQDLPKMLGETGKSGKTGRKASYGVLGYVGKAALRGGEMKAFGGCDLKFVVTPGTDSGNALRFKKKKKICFVCFFFNGLLRDVILIFTFCFGVFLGGCFLCCICASHGACWPSNEFSG